jgi:hypothetical protein
VSSGAIVAVGIVVYDLQGNEVWTRSWTEANGQPWLSVRVAGFWNGGPVLAGEHASGDPTNGDDVATIAFDASGNELWRRALANPIDEFIAAAALDGTGALYVVGEYRGDVFPFEDGGFALKLSASGSLAWSVRRSQDFFLCLTIDAQGYAYAGGMRSEPARMLMTAFDPTTGAERFSHTMQSDGFAWMAAIRAGPDGRIVATGSRYTLTHDFLAFTIAIDAQGVELWRAAVDAALPMTRAHGEAIDIDSAGDVVVAGFERDEVGLNVRPFAVRYPRSIAPLASWTSRDLPATPSGAAFTTARGVAVALDRDGSVRLAGQGVAPDGQKHRIAWRLVPDARITGLGDGGQGACPCGNESAPSERAGCANSLGVGGKLEWTGTPSISADSLALFATSIPGSTTALYVQGTGVTGPGVLSGDGLAFLGTPIVRLRTVQATSTGIARCPAAWAPPISVQGSVAGPGSVHTYQVRYRNAASFCTAAPWNMTNAVEVVWRP